MGREHKEVFQCVSTPLSRLGFDIMQPLRIRAQNKPPSTFVAPYMRAYKLKVFRIVVTAGSNSYSGLRYCQCTALTTRGLGSLPSTRPLTPFEAPLSYIACLGMCTLTSPIDVAALAPEAFDPVQAPTRVCGHTDTAEIFRA